MGSGAAQVLRGGHFPRLRQPKQFWLFVSHKLLRWLSPFFIVLLIGLTVALTVRDARFTPVLAAGMMILVLSAIGAVSLASRNYRLVAIPFYFVMSQIGLGYGLLKGLVTRQKATWERTERTTQTIATK